MTSSFFLLPSTYIAKFVNPNLALILNVILIATLSVIKTFLLPEIINFIAFSNRLLPSAFCYSVSLQLWAIALAFSPSNFSHPFPAAQLLVGQSTPDGAQERELKPVVGDRTVPNSTPDAARIDATQSIYLYGQSAEPEQIKQEYFVFEVRQGKLVGAFYLPRSAFYCFYGSIEVNQLNLTVVDTYDGSRSPYSVNLQQYHHISTVSDNDRRILGICKRAHQDEVWGK
ncbi:hypothetical protein [Microcoleus sp. CAWBG640]|uniref:hypothetical protein n=1 Tax=Microcoleus sp. CAWBG640 TaxID=2841653 RepID=UPI00312B2D84